MATWGFYGRSEQLAQVDRIVGRRRWFFARVTGRRRIGKTTLIQHALTGGTDRRMFYAQIPDSGQTGVLSAVADYLETFQVPAERFPRPRTLPELARLIRLLAEAGYIVVLDEFQYFGRKVLFEFTSFLQAEVDALRARADQVPGGLFVLGSIHSDMVALLEDQSAPLFNRVTDSIDLDHWDIAAVTGVLREFGAWTPGRLLFLWSLFEGVPKFYRDCHEERALAVDRPDLLRRLFFNSSSPLRTEADNWFLHELRGRYDVVLKSVAKHPGRMHGELQE